MRLLSRSSIGNAWMPMGKNIGSWSRRFITCFSCLRWLTERSKSWRCAIAPIRCGSSGSRTRRAFTRSRIARWWSFGRFATRIIRIRSMPPASSPTIGPANGYGSPRGLSRGWRASWCVIRTVSISLLRWSTWGFSSVSRVGIASRSTERAVGAPSQMVARAPSLMVPLKKC